MLSYLGVILHWNSDGFQVRDFQELAFYSQEYKVRDDPGFYSENELQLMNDDYIKSGPSYLSPLLTSTLVNPSTSGAYKQITLQPDKYGTFDKISNCTDSDKISGT